MDNEPCFGCDRPIDFAVAPGQRAYCTTCTQIRLHNPRLPLTFPRDEQTDLTFEPIAEEAA